MRFERVMVPLRDLFFVREFSKDPVTSIDMLAEQVKKEVVHRTAVLAGLEKEAGALPGKVDHANRDLVRAEEKLALFEEKRPELEVKITAHNLEQDRLTAYRMKQCHRDGCTNIRRGDHKTVTTSAKANRGKRVFCRHDAGLRRLIPAKLYRELRTTHGLKVKITE